MCDQLLNILIDKKICFAKICFILPFWPDSARPVEDPWGPYVLRLCWTDLFQILRIGKHMGGDDQSGIHFMIVVANS